MKISLENLYIFNKTAFSQYDCPIFSQLNYTLDHQINDTTIAVTFRSKGMNWVSARIIMWLTSR